MEKFLKYVFATLFFVLAFTPVAAGILDMMLMFLFDFTLLQWGNGRVTFAICWTLLPCPIFFKMFCEVMDS